MEDQIVLVEPRQSQTRLLTTQNAIINLKRQMVAGVHYGAPYPGSRKDTLLKPGGELLAHYFGIRVDYEALEERFDVDIDNPARSFVFYRYRAVAYDMRSGIRVAEAIGSCNSLEQKYGWRDAKPVCPVCGQETIQKSRQEPGYFCWAKLGGCGSKFAADDPRITSQPVGRVRNPNPAELVNTIDKMAQKRAFVSAVILACGAGAYFTSGDDVSVDLYTVVPDDENVIEAQFSIIPDDDRAELHEESASVPVVNGDKNKAPTGHWSDEIGKIQFLLGKLRENGIDDAFVRAYLGSEDLHAARVWSRYATGNEAYTQITGAFAAQAPKAKARGDKPDWNRIIEQGKQSMARDSRDPSLSSEDELIDMLEELGLTTWVVERFDVDIESFSEAMPKTALSQIESLSDIGAIKQTLTDVWMRTTGRPIVPDSLSYRSRDGKKGGVLAFHHDGSAILAYSRSQVDKALNDIGIQLNIRDMQDGDVKNEINASPDGDGARFVVSYKLIDSDSDKTRFDFVGVDIAQHSYDDIIGSVVF